MTINNLWGFIDLSWSTATGLVATPCRFDPVLKSRRCRAGLFVACLCSSSMEETGPIANRAHHLEEEKPHSHEPQTEPHKVSVGVGNIPF